MNRHRFPRACQVRVTFGDLFEGPTVASLCEVIERDGSQLVTPRVLPRSQEDVHQHPLSHAQEGLWFLWKLRPDSPYYTFQGVVYFYGSIAPDQLTSAWRVLFERHEILRTAFAENEGKPMQYFRDSTLDEIPLTDLTCFGEDQRMSPLHEAARREARQPFDLERP